MLSLAIVGMLDPITDREQGCYYRLVRNLGDDFIVFPQVAFSAFLRIQGGTEQEAFALFGTMRQKVADFLICRRDFKVLAVVELDDRSHDDKKEQDKRRDAAIKQAGLLVMRLPNTPNDEPIQRLAEVLKPLDQPARDQEQAAFKAGHHTRKPGSASAQI